MKKEVRQCLLITVLAMAIAVVFSAPLFAAVTCQHYEGYTSCTDDEGGNATCSTNENGTTTCY